MDPDILAGLSFLSMRLFKLSTALVKHFVNPLSLPPPRAALLPPTTAKAVTLSN
jgi:hypothetical protein